MNRKDLRPKLAAPVDRSAIKTSFKTEAIDLNPGIHPSRYHVKFASDAPLEFFDEDDLYLWLLKPPN